MSDPVLKTTAIIVLTGASGAGKTTLIRRLNEANLAGVKGINCDRAIDQIPETENPCDLQAALLSYWLKRLDYDEERVRLAVLDTQIRPHRALEVLRQAGIHHRQIVLVDCEFTKRNARLRGERGQPELVSAQMDCWAAYLRGQADALNLSIIDTSEDTAEQSLETLIRLVEEMLNQAR